MHLTTFTLALLTAGGVGALSRGLDSNRTDPAPIPGSYIVEYAPVGQTPFFFSPEGRYCLTLIDERGSTKQNCYQ